MPSSGHNAQSGCNMSMQPWVYVSHLLLLQNRQMSTVSVNLFTDPSPLRYPCAEVSVFYHYPIAFRVSDVFVIRHNGATISVMKIAARTATRA